MKKLWILALLVFVKPTCALADDSPAPVVPGQYALHDDTAGNAYLLNTVTGELWVGTTDPKSHRKVFIPCYVVHEPDTQKAMAALMVDRIQERISKENLSPQTK